MQLQSVFFSKAMYGKTFNTPSNPTTDTYCPTGPTTVTMATAQLFFFSDAFPLPRINDDFPCSRNKEQTCGSRHKH